jgi:nuclease-like protein
VTRGAAGPPGGGIVRAPWEQFHMRVILMAGADGERLVAAGLGRVLDDDWTLIRGYRNRRGEIDHLLLGPRGLSRSRASTATRPYIARATIGSTPSSTPTATRWSAVS